MLGAVQLSVSHGEKRQCGCVAVTKGESTESPRFLVTVGIITAFMLCCAVQMLKGCVVVTNGELVQTITQRLL